MKGTASIITALPPFILICAARRAQCATCSGVFWARSIRVRILSGREWLWKKIAIKWTVGFLLIQIVVACLGCVVQRFLCSGVCLQVCSFFFPLVVGFVLSRRFKFRMRCTEGLKVTLVIMINVLLVHYFNTLAVF